MGQLRSLWQWTISFPVLAQSALFGHVKGGEFELALQDKIGLIEEANNGMLILDGLSELPRSGAGNAVELSSKLANTERLGLQRLKMQK